MTNTVLRFVENMTSDQLLGVESKLKEQRLIHPNKSLASLIDETNRILEQQSKTYEDISKHLDYIMEGALRLKTVDNSYPNQEIMRYTSIVDGIYAVSFEVHPLEHNEPCTLCGSEQFWGRYSQYVGEGYTIPFVCIKNLAKSTPDASFSAEGEQLALRAPVSQHVTLSMTQPHLMEAHHFYLQGTQKGFKDSVKRVLEVFGFYKRSH